MADVIIVFNPEGIAPDDYRKKYPELESIPEFKPLKPRELIFVWYYSNQTSFILYQYPEKKDRVLQSASKAFGTPVAGMKFAEDFLNRKLPGQSKIEEAVRRMEKIMPTVRFQAVEMVNHCFKDFQDLLAKPLKDFTKPDGTLDINSYMAIRKSVLKELEDMVRIREVGFGIASNEDKKIDGQSVISHYLKGKEQNT